MGSYVTLMEVTSLRLVLMLSRDVHCSLQLHQSFSLGHIILSCVQERSAIHPEGDILSEEHGDTTTTLSCTLSAFAPLPTHIIRSLYNLLPTHSPIPLNLVYFLNACWSHMESCGFYAFSLIYFLRRTICMSPDSIFILKPKTQHLQVYMIFPFQH